MKTSIQTADGIITVQNYGGAFLFETEDATRRTRTILSVNELDQLIDSAKMVREASDHGVRSEEDLSAALKLTLIAAVEDDLIVVEDFDRLTDRIIGVFSKRGLTRKGRR